MAAKLNKALKNIDNYTRNLNNQLSKAYNRLGGDSQTYKNLVTHAKLYFNTKENSKGIIQIARGKKDLDNYRIEHKITQSKRSYYTRYQNKDGTKQIRNAFNVTQAEQRAIKAIQQQNRRIKHSNAIVNITQDRAKAAKEGRTNIRIKKDKSGTITTKQIQKKIQLLSKQDKIGSMYQAFIDDTWQLQAQGYNIPEIQKKYEDTLERLRNGELENADDIDNAVQEILDFTSEQKETEIPVNELHNWFKNMFGE